MTRPKYTVVIPTRNRAEYVAYAVRSCLADRADVEIVVSDNSDPEQAPATLAAVEQYVDDAVRYVRPSDVALSMSRHWEWALRQANGEYITVIGDDDALLPFTFSTIDKILDRTKLPLVQWRTLVYAWPCYSAAPISNWLSIPVPKDNTGAVYYDLRSTRELIRSVATLSEVYQELPMVYNSMVSRDLIQRMLDSGSPSLGAQSPDIFSGFVLAHLTPLVCSVRTPLGICGQSAKSNGVAVQCHVQQSVATDFHRLNAIDQLYWPSEVPEVPTYAAGVWESYVRYRDRFGPGAVHANMPRRRFVASSTRDLLSANFTADKREVHFDTLRSYFGPSMARYVQRLRHRLQAVTPTFRTGLSPDRLIVQGDDVGVRDVRAAAQFVAKILNPESTVQLNTIEPALPAVTRLLRQRLPRSVVRFASNAREYLLR